MPLDVDSVLSIALSPTLPEDRVIWALTSSGKFSVKSAYKVALQERSEHLSEESSNAKCMKEFWKFIPAGPKQNPEFHVASMQKYLAHES